MRIIHPVTVLVGNENEAVLGGLWSGFRGIRGGFALIRVLFKTGWINANTNTNWKQ